MSMSLKEHDYIGLSEASKMENKGGLNMKATELRLGLPGSESPERNLVKNNNLVAGAKRVFSDTINGGSGNWVFNVNGGSEGDTKNSVLCSKESVLASEKDKSQVSSIKAQVVGWPPIRSFRKNTMAPKNDKEGWPPIRSFRKNVMDSSSPNNENDLDSKSGSSSCLYVKVSMDGAPYLRKVDLKIYSTYVELSSALEKMFSCFTIGQCSSAAANGSMIKVKDLLHGSEYVLTYEDKDGDWMLVGDVPWDMFTGSCKRMRIMKSSEAIGLAPRVMEKCKNQN